MNEVYTGDKVGVGIVSSHHLSKVSNQPEDSAQEKCASCNLYFHI